MKYFNESRAIFEEILCKFQGGKMWAIETYRCRTLSKRPSVILNITIFHLKKAP